jgi:hypothetical protein
MRQIGERSRQPRRIIIAGATPCSCLVPSVPLEHHFSWPLRRRSERRRLFSSQPQLIPRRRRGGVPVLAIMKLIA